MEAEITISVHMLITILVFVTALLGVYSVELSHRSWRQGFYECEKIYDQSTPKNYKDWVKEKLK